MFPSKRMARWDLVKSSRGKNSSEGVHGATRHSPRHVPPLVRLWRVVLRTRRLLWREETDPERNAGCTNETQIQISMISVNESRGNLSSKPHSREHYANSVYCAYSSMIPSWFLSSSSRPHRTALCYLEASCDVANLLHNEIQRCRVRSQPRWQIRTANLCKGLRICSRVLLIFFFFFFHHERAWSSRMPRRNRNLISRNSNIKLQSRMIVNRSEFLFLRDINVRTRLRPINHGTTSRNSEPSSETLVK